MMMGSESKGLRSCQIRKKVVRMKSRIIFRLIEYFDFIANIKAGNIEEKAEQGNVTQLTPACLGWCVMSAAKTCNEIVIHDI